MLKCWIIRADLAMSPVPDIVHEPPNNVEIASNYLTLGPQVSRTEPWKLLEVIHNFGEVGLDLRLIAGLSLNALDNFILPIESIDQICKQNACPAVLWKVLL